MRRLLTVFLILALVVTGLYAAGGSQAGGSQRRIVVQIGTENNPGEPLTEGLMEWKRLAEEMSNGALEVHVFPSSSLGHKDQLIDQMMAGIGVITNADGGFFADRGVPDFGITFAPYFFATWEEAWNLIESDWYARQSRLLEDRGMKIVASNWVYGDRHTLTRRPIRTLEDFRGLKLRVPNNLIQIRGTEVMGASPAPMPLGEVYTALQQGVVDGLENSIPALDGFRFYEVAKYLTLTAHIRNLIPFITSAQWYNTLSREHQDIIIESGRLAGLHNNRLQAIAEEAAIANFRANGVEIIEVDMARFINQAQPFYSMQEFRAIWSPNIIEETNRAKAGR